MMIKMHRCLTSGSEVASPFCLVRVVVSHTQLHGNSSEFVTVTLQSCSVSWPLVTHVSHVRYKLLVYEKLVKYVLIIKIVVSNIES